MTCSRCASDNTKYPKTSEWGPLVWKILHTLAERAGKQSNEILRGDEMRGWLLLVKTLVATLPCEECRAHATSYINEFPFEPPQVYQAWSLYVRSYFYTFHEAVNERLGKPSYPFSSLAETYKSTGELNQWTKDLEGMVTRAMKLNGLNMQAWLTWRNHVRMVRASMGI